MRVVFLLVVVLVSAVVLAGAEDLQKRGPPSDRCKRENKQLLEFRNSLRKELKNCEEGNVDYDLVSAADSYIRSLPKRLCRENPGQRNVFVKRRREVINLIDDLYGCGEDEIIVLAS